MGKVGESLRTFTLDVSLPYPMSLWNRDHISIFHIYVCGCIRDFFYVRVLKQKFTVLLFHCRFFGDPPGSVDSKLSSSSEQPQYFTVEKKSIVDTD